MKAQSTGNNNERGSGILEIIIAVAILTLGISAATLLSFANQTLKTDSGTSSEALYKAKGALENARASSTADFLGIVSTTTSDGIYTKKLTVNDLTPCRKEVTSNITWQLEARPQKIALTTDLADIAGTLALGGDCASEPPVGGWTAPTTLLSRDLNYKAAYNDNPSVDSSAGTPATDVDVLNKMVYMTALSNKDDFFVLDATNVVNSTYPPIIGSLNTGGTGLNSVDVMHNNTTGKTYAFVVQNENANQFQVLDVSSSTNPLLIASETLPNITFTCSPASKPCLAGQTISYYNGRVYIGTNYIANLILPPTKNNEFHVYCVSDPSIPGCSPSTPIWLGSANVNHNVNAITVRGNYAYLATSNDNNELMVYDISNPGNITQVGGFNANRTGSDNEDAISLFVLGNRLYLGRDIVSSSSERDFYILDISNPTSPVELCPTCSVNLSSLVVPNISGSTITGIRVSGKFAFLALNDSNVGFLTLDISNPASSLLLTPYNFSNYTTGLDLEGAYIYTSNNQNDGLRIIRPAQCADKIDNDADSLIDSADPQCHTDGNAGNTASYNPEIDNE